MNIYEALKKDHEEVKALLNELVSLGEGDEGRRNDLISQIRDGLIPHSRAEEAVFYNAMRAMNSANDIVMHGYQEHVEAEALLRTLQVAGKIDTGWTAVAKKLREALVHHINEEEGKIFSVAKEMFSEEEAVQMAAAFEELKPEIQKEGLLGTTADLVANLLPARIVESLKRFKSESPATQSSVKPPENY